MFIQQCENPYQPPTYLASPYSDQDPAVRELRYRQVCEAAGILLRAGVTVFSPIAHSHAIEIEKGGGLATWEFWRPIDLGFLQMCPDMIVLMLDGWKNSIGVREEILQARAWGKPIAFVTLDALRRADIDGIVSPVLHVASRHDVHEVIPLG